MSASYRILHRLIAGAVLVAASVGISRSAVAQDSDWMRALFGQGHLLTTYPGSETPDRLVLVLGVGHDRAWPVHTDVGDALCDYGDMLLTISVPSRRRSDPVTGQATFVPHEVPEDGSSSRYTDVALTRTRMALMRLAVHYRLNLTALPLRIVAIGAGAEFAVRLINAGDLAPDELLLVRPEFSPDASLEPAFSREGSPYGRRRLLHTTVLLAGTLPAALAEQAHQARRVLAPAVVDVLGSPPLDAINEAAPRQRGGGSELNAHLHGLAAAVDGLRLFDSRSHAIGSGIGQVVQMDELVARAAEADVVVLGEQHDNVRFQRFAARFLARLTERSNRPVALSMEMFERDVQPVLNRYLAGEIDEAQFLAHSRPWPNYRRSYRRLIELARNRGLAVIAGNVPRRFAAQVAREGLGALEGIEPAWVPETVHAGPGAYRDKFVAAMEQMMASHGHGGEPDTERTDRMFAAQALKDDAMAEAILAHLAASSEPGPVLHLNGQFHSDGRLGMVERLLMHDPDLDVLVLTCVSHKFPTLADASLADPAVADIAVVVPPMPGR